MSLPTCLVYSPGIASGVELMGMPMPTLIQSTFKTIESEYHNCIIWELIPNGFLCKESKFSFYFIQHVFPFVPLKMWAVKKKKKKKKKQSALKNENTNYFGITFTWFLTCP